MNKSHTVRVDSILLNKMLKSGCLKIKQNKDLINNLNVFPVPDGDTGTNMFLTVSGSSFEEPSAETPVGEYLKDYCSRILFSARGNSGIILSQYLYGFSNYTLSLKEFDVENFKNALKDGVSNAYHSVIKPTEGTILTVMREACEAAEKINFQSFEEFFDFYILKMKETLSNTPKMLQCLMDAGVVDSGGAGLVLFFEGMQEALSGKISAETDDEILGKRPDLSSVRLSGLTDGAEMKYGYCTDFLLKLNNSEARGPVFDLETVISFLNSSGESVVAFSDGDIVKIHVHTKRPGDILNYMQQYGEFVTMKIENMDMQSGSAEKAPETPKKKFAVVAVVCGEGFERYFREFGTDAVIYGGQTSNPPVRSFIDAYKSLSAEKIIVLPNNSNTIMAAKQSAEIYEDAEIEVLPTKSIAEGLSAISVMDETISSFEDMISDMTFAFSNVTTGYVTTATRDCELDGVTITEGSYIGLTDDKILVSGKDPNDVARQLVKKINSDEDKQVVTAYYGCDISEESAGSLADAISEDFPFLETGIVSGGQKVYSYILSVE